MKGLITFFILIFCILLEAGESKESVFQLWDRFEKSLRDELISPKEAYRQFNVIREMLYITFKDIYFEGFRDWIFPVEGYDLYSSTGPGGFKPGGYDFYDAKKRDSHPALDLFVIDKNRDSLDDKTLQPFSIVAPVDMVILSVCTVWTENSHLRGGKYIWAYNPPENLLLYFAHFDKIIVFPSQVIRKGERIGFLGRTGKNAFSPRSDTHLHFMILDISKDKVCPVNPWYKLKRK